MRILAGLWLCAALAGCARGDATARLSVSFAQIGGLNLTPALLNQSLRSGAMQVRASYEPVLTVPGMTASIARCGLLNLPCVEAQSHTEVLPASALHIHDDNSMEIDVPLSASGRSLYRLSTLEIEIPTPWHVQRLIRESVSFWFEKGAEEQPQGTPFQVLSGVYVLQGVVRFSADGMRLKHNSTLQSTGCNTDIQRDEKGRFVFGRSPQIAAYAQYISAYQSNDWMVDQTTGATREVYPGELPASLASYAGPPQIKRVTLATAAGRLEAIGIRAKGLDRSAARCEQEIDVSMLFLEGKVLSYSHSIEQPACEGNGGSRVSEAVQLWDAQVETYHRHARRDGRASENTFWHRLSQYNPPVCGAPAAPAPPRNRIDNAINEAQRWRALFNR